MGQTCSACSDSCPNGADINAPSSNRRDKKGENSEGQDHDYNPTYTELSSDEDEDEPSVPYTMNQKDDTGSVGSTTSNPDDIEVSVMPDELTDEDIEGAYNSWKTAIEQGNETLAAFCVQEYPLLDMYQFRWDNGDNALHSAVRNKYPRLAFFLLTQGVGVNVQNIVSQESALHLAVRNKDHKIVELLLNWDADPNTMNLDKQTPISIAQDFSDDQGLMDVLLEARAKLHGNANAVDTTTPDVDEDELPDLRQKTTSMRMDAWTAKRQIRTPESESADSAESESSVAPVVGSGYEDDTDGANYTELQKVTLKSKNPFTKLGRQKTVEAKKVIKDALKDKPLPKLESWLEKKKPGGVAPTYQKRWVSNKGAHLLWSSKQRTITNDANREERKKFNGSIHLTTIEKVSPIQTSANNKFMVKAKDAKNDNEMREYVFRCNNKRERDFWCFGLKEHMHRYRKVMQYLGR